MASILQYMNPRWSEDPWLTPGKVISRIVSAFHRECDVPACHMLSLMWGTGWPALYSHENLDEITHRRGGDLYGPTSYVLTKGDVVEIQVVNWDAGKHPLCVLFYSFPFLFRGGLMPFGQPFARTQVPDRAQVDGRDIGRPGDQPAAR